MLGAPLDTVTLIHHAEAIAAVPGKRRVSYGAPILRDGERVWRTFSDIDTSQGALPYEQILGDRDYVEHLARAALAAGAGHHSAVGQTTAYLFDARRLVEHAARWIEKNFPAQNPSGNCLIVYRPSPMDASNARSCSILYKIWDNTSRKTGR